MFPPLARRILPLIGIAILVAAESASAASPTLRDLLQDGWEIKTYMPAAEQLVLQKGNRAAFCDLGKRHRPNYPGADCYIIE